MNQSQVTLQPYRWAGAYAQWRDGGAAPHDPGLCADVRAPWMADDERIIIRACEIIGYPEGFLYDDHLPPAEPEGRGKDYRHIAFQWDADQAPAMLAADCPVPGKGWFGLKLRGGADFVDVELSLRNDMDQAMGPIDWAFCPITLESPQLRDPQHERTFIYDGARLRSFAEMDGLEHFNVYPVAGAGGFRPVGHAALHTGSIVAQASVMIVEGESGRYTTAVGFEQSYECFGCRGNMCFHADPFFGVLAPRQRKTIRGRLYLIAGDAETAFARYRRDFPQS